VSGLLGTEEDSNKTGKYDRVDYLLRLHIILTRSTSPRILLYAIPAGMSQEVAAKMELESNSGALALITLLRLECTPPIQHFTKSSHIPPNKCQPASFLQLGCQDLETLFGTALMHRRPVCQH